MNTLLGTKVQQTQGFLENGARIPVTVIAASSNAVIGLKTPEKDNYSAAVMGFGKKKKPTKALLGTIKKANLQDAPSVVYEVKGEDVASLELGTQIRVEDVFKPGDIVDVAGQSKGKGFAGGVKRYGFRGGPRTHGQSDRERAPGSIGQTTTPGRVYKGKRMAGNMGDERVTVKNLVVIDINPTTQQVHIKGLVPGILGGVVTVTKVGEVKEQNFVPLLKPAEPEPVVEETPAEEQAAEAEAVPKEEAPETKEASAASEETVAEQSAPEEKPAEEKTAEGEEAK